MPKRTGSNNVYLRQLIVKLEKAAKKNEAAIWKDVAEALVKPRGQKVEVNLADIARHAEKGSTVIVPGAVLAKGELTEPVTIAAWRFSAGAKEKIKKAKCVAMSIDELMSKSPKGSNVKIMM